jgi:hypothetical protein
MRKYTPRRIPYWGEYDPHLCYNQPVQVGRNEHGWRAARFWKWAHPLYRDRAFVVVFWTDGKAEWRCVDVRRLAVAGGNEPPPMPDWAACPLGADRVDGAVGCGRDVVALRRQGDGDDR